MVRRASLRSVRERKQLTQRDMAEKLSLTETAYRNIESGRNRPSFTTAIRISKVLDSSIESLFDVDFLINV